MAEPMVLETELAAQRTQTRRAKELAIAKRTVEADAPTIFGFTAAQIAALPVEKLDHMLQMQERMRAEEARKSYNAAMNAAQGEMGRISTDALNPQTKSRYASYGQLDKALRPIYTGHGFAVSFNTGEPPEQHVRVLASVSHRDGHTESFKADIPVTTVGFKGTAMMTPTHATGSAMSYGQRYLLKLIFNVAIGESDDDGNGAGVAQTMVSDEQATELQRLISEKQLVPARVYAWVGKKLKVEPVNYPKTVSDIPARLYPEVVAQIKAAE